MKLSLLTESDVLNRGKKLLGDVPSADKIIQTLLEADPTRNKKYLPWLIKQYKNSKIKIDKIKGPTNPQLRLPEDAPKLQEALGLLEKHRTGINVFDFDWYSLDDKLDEFRVSKGSLTSHGSYPGAEIVKTRGPYTLIRVPRLDGTNDEQKITALKKLGLGTKWCTREDYPDSQAEEYLNQTDVYVILKDGKPYLQFDYSSNQAMNVKDQPALKNLGKTFPEMVSQNSSLAYIYARDVIHGRWPEAEPNIMKDPESAYWYAKNVIEDRWLEAEPYIKQDQYWAHWYAKDVTKTSSPWD
jgi:hypothetical protein